MEENPSLTQKGDQAMKSIEAIYLLFAVAHPLSELIGRTSLRKFLNEDYYEPPRENFPVTKRSGIGGSLFVLLVLIIPLVVSLRYNQDVVFRWWCLAFGLVLADLVQHAFHVISRPRNWSPRVHLITIVGTLAFLPWIAADLHQGMLTIGHLLILLLGAALIFANWSRNSWRVNYRSYRSHAPEGKPLLLTDSPGSARVTG